MTQERMEQISQLIWSDAEHLPSHALHAGAEFVVPSTDKDFH